MSIAASAGGKQPDGTKGKGQAYFERWQANRAWHAGVLLPPPAPDDPLAPVINPDELRAYLRRELWAYTFGEPSPHADLEAEQLQLEGGTPNRVPAAQQQQTQLGQQLQGIVIPPPPQGLLHLPPPEPPPLPLPYDPAAAQVHVYWDVAAKHPAAADPRVVAERLRRLAAHYGRPAGLYAYALRKDWNWVPQHFLRYRAPLGGDPQLVVPQQQRAGEDSFPPSGAWRAEPLEEAERAGWDACGRCVCPVCGATRWSLPELQAHLRALHPASTAAAAAAAAGRGGGAEAGAAAAAAGSAGGAGAEQALPLAGPGQWRNTSRRTLGAVAQYHTARGATQVPPRGHQLSLKYCLTWEGWENAAEAPSVSLASGLSRLLDRARRSDLPAPQSVRAPGGGSGRAGGGGQGRGGHQGQLVVLVVAEDEARLQQPLLRLRGVGGALTVVLRRTQEVDLDSHGGSGQARKRGQPPKLAARERQLGGGRDGDARVAAFRGADLLVGWQEVMAGLDVG